MKSLFALVASAAVATSALAGPAEYSSKSSKGVIPPSPPAPVCPCFAPGAAFGVFGGGYLPSHGPLENSLGGGALFEYFFTENIGIQLSYGAYATSPVHHVYGGDLVFRFPITELCLAPYILVGGGGDSDGVNRGYGDAGGGVDIRFDNMNCMGIFIDGTYHWTGDSDHDFTLVRVGIKFPL